ncbi:putative F-box/kelch-repeat protein At1g12870 [Camellia sinensis]|uniref:putative F-box/kelch-repeat protein At1g12870 n=1 Tax=Camellia sinensis TaxID=4442 RepID=UPI001035864D|nr:putative F-box/kelch-repeat protein At1g12870 [Camellia sinensis]
MAKPWKSKNSSEEALCNASNVSEEDKEKIEAVVKYKSPSTVNSAGHRQEQEQDHENEEEKMTKKISNKRRKLVTGCTPLQDSLAVEVISNVDLLSEILLRVPTKSLIRFKCVSKHWLSLISDSQFSSNHTRRTNISVISGLYFYSNWMLKDVNSVSLQSHSTLPPFTFLDGVGEESTRMFVNSCNGLLLCSKIYRQHYIVCNLTTQKYTALPARVGTSFRLFYDKLVLTWLLNLQNHLATKLYWLITVLIMPEALEDLI